MQFDTDDDLNLRQQLRFLQVVTSLRFAWLNMISEFRLYVANRFGVFSSEFHVGMESRLTNVHYYAEEIPDYLNRLESMAESDQQGLAFDTPLQQIEQHYQAWMKAFKQLLRILDNPNWRKDLLLMRETVSPTLDRMRQRLSYLNLDLDTQTARDITRLTGFARQLSESILAISIAGTFLILIAYLFPRRYLLKPIAQTAMALKQEAQGLVDIEPLPLDCRRQKIWSMPSARCADRCAAGNAAWIIWSTTTP